MITINSYDIDGVIFMGEVIEGLRPGPNDVIITGRSYTQKDETLNMLRSRGINNFVFFNPLERTHPNYGKEASGKHKAKVLTHLAECGIIVQAHFEDDPIQIKMIERYGPPVKVVKVGNEQYAV
jgi:hypothetical protein